MEISIKELMEASPALAPKDKPHGNKDIDIKKNLFVCGTSNRKTVIEKTVFKMANDYTFCEEALKKNFFEDFLESTKRKNKSKTFRSFMICHRYWS